MTKDISPLVKEKTRIMLRDRRLAVIDDLWTCFGNLAEDQIIREPTTLLGEPAYAYRSTKTRRFASEQEVYETLMRIKGQLERPTPVSSKRKPSQNELAALALRYGPDVGIDMEHEPGMPPHISQKGVPIDPDQAYRVLQEEHSLERAMYR